MIADIGCPNSVISSKDVDTFVRNLSQFQQENLEMISADEKFKFGPSGPFGCSEKLRFPIEVDSKPFWIEVAIVKADIPSFPFLFITRQSTLRTITCVRF